MPTFALDWSDTNLGGSAVVAYADGAILDFVDKPAGATAALSITPKQADTGIDLVQLEVETSGSSVLTFAYKASTESGWDKLQILVDDVNRGEWSGAVAWTTHAGISIPAAGVHSIRFRYQKDAGGAALDDRVWVALLNVTNTVTVNDDTGGVIDLLDFEDGTIPAALSTSTWTNSTSAPISGTRSMRSPAATAANGSYDLEVTKPATDAYRAVPFDLKVSSESGWDKLIVFPDASAATVPATGAPSTNGAPGWLELSGTVAGHYALITPPAARTFLFRYTKDGSGNVGADAAWVDNLGLPSAGGGATELDRAQADTATAADTVTRARTGPRAAADVAQPADTLARSSTRPRAAADAAQATDGTSATVTRNAARATADTAHPTDTLARARTGPRAAADTAQATDAGVRRVARPRALTDTAHPTDTTAGVRTGAPRLRTLGEALTLADTSSASSAGVTSRTQTDAATVVDVDARLVARARGQSDAAAPADSSTRARTGSRALAELVTVVDAAAGVRQLARAALELVALADTNSTAPGAPVIHVRFVSATGRQRDVDVAGRRLEVEIRGRTRTDTTSGRPRTT